jgi:hypothetical protein
MNPLNDSNAWAITAAWWTAALVAAGWIAVVGAQLGRAKVAAQAAIRPAPRH